MQNQPLLERQTALLSYLTDPRQYDRKPEAEGLFGIDLYRLRLEGRFSLEKRAGKLMAVFPRSFEAMRKTPGAELKNFAAACPPFSITRYDNGAQFLGFVRGLWETEPPQPIWLPDLAALELAMSKVAQVDPTEDEEAPDVEEGAYFRLRTGVEFLTAQYDIRPLLANPEAELTPEKRPVFLVVAPPNVSGPPRIFELKQAPFDFLNALQGWTPLAGVGGFAALVAALIENNVMEKNR
jgi:hypothetical protein